MAMDFALHSFFSSDISWPHDIPIDVLQLPDFGIQHVKPLQP